MEQWNMSWVTEREGKSHVFLPTLLSSHNVWYNIANHFQRTTRNCISEIEVQFQFSNTENIQDTTQYIYNLVSTLDHLYLCFEIKRVKKNSRDFFKFHFLDLSFFKCTEIQYILRYIFSTDFISVLSSTLISVRVAVCSFANMHSRCESSSRV